MSIKKINPLQKKGLLTVLLIILGEWITLTNAVQFWSTYQSWSNQYGRGRFENQKSGHSSSSHEELKQNHLSNLFNGILNNNQRKSTSSATLSTSNTCTNTKSQENQLHPRKLTRATTIKCTTAMYHCCQTKAPSCIPLDIRGGHLTHNHDSSTSSSATTIIADTILSSMSSSSHPPAPYNIPLNIWKIIFQIFLTALNVACWLLPLKSQNITENKLMLSLANAFSGGVFLTLAFGHLIPECLHGFEGTSIGDNEALPFMIVLGGYLLIFFVEKVAFDAHGLMHEAEHHHAHQNGKVVTTKKEDDNSGGGLNVGRSAVILLGALAVHSVLEMTALGLARSFGDSALLTLSIALHQPAESIALLVAFLKSGMPKPDIIKYLSIFSACGPIGVAIGMAVNEFASPIIDSMMLATVAGTFIYVGATEVIPEEWEDQQHKWKKFFALISGIVSIFAITQYTMTLEGH